MCGRFLLSVDIEELLEQYRAIKGFSVPTGGYPLSGLWQESFLPPLPQEIFPSNIVPVVAAAKPRLLIPMKWGFSSPYAKGLIINARGETADSKPLFREAFQQRRCIIPAEAFFEWKRESKAAIKYRIRHKEQPYFSMAGMYGDFKDKEGKVVQAFTILTTAPSPMIAQIHDRMPVILPKEAEALWLDSSICDPTVLKSLLKPYDIQGEQLEMNLA